MEAMKVTRKRPHTATTEQEMNPAPGRGRCPSRTMTAAERKRARARARRGLDPLESFKPQIRRSRFSLEPLKGMLEADLALCARLMAEPPGATGDFLMVLLEAGGASPLLLDLLVQWRETPVQEGAADLIHQMVEELFWDRWLEIKLLEPAWTPALGAGPMERAFEKALEAMGRGAMGEATPDEPWEVPRERIAYGERSPWDPASWLGGC